MEWPYKRGGLFREVEIAGIGAVGTWWSGLNREVVSLGRLK